MKIVIDSRGLIQSDPNDPNTLSVNGTTTLVGNVVVSGSMTMSGTLSSTPLTNPIFYIAVTGSDVNSGTAASPLLTLNEAFKRLSFGYTGVCLINLGLGTFNLGSTPILMLPPQGSGLANPLMMIGAMSASNLGTRTASAGTVGSGQTFGTVTDSVGGLTSNAWKGWFLRFTSGNNSGRSFMVAANTTSVFTICGALFGSVVNGDTFVMEKPGSQLTWTGNFSFIGSGGTIGLQNVELAAPGGSSIIRIVQTDLEVSALWFTNIGSGQCQFFYGTKISLLQQSTLFANTGLTSTPAGIYFQAAAAGNGLFLGATSRTSLRRCVFDNVPVLVDEPAFIQLTDTYHSGSAFIKCINNGFLSLQRNRLEAVNPATTGPGGNSGAAIVVATGAKAFLLNVDISSTTNTTAPGDAILLNDGCAASLQSVTGTGNAGVGVRIRRGSGVKNLLSNTISGSAGEIQLGSSGSVTTWSAANAATVNDIGMGTASEFCWIAQ